MDEWDCDVPEWEFKANTTLTINDYIGNLKAGRKNSKFFDLRPTTPKHEMFYHFKSHLAM